MGIFNIISVAAGAYCVHNIYKRIHQHYLVTKTIPDTITMINEYAAKHPELYDIVKHKKENENK